MSDLGPPTSDVAEPAPAWTRLPTWAWIVAAGLLAHGLMPLTDYVLWDGWWYAADLVRPEGSPVMARLFHEVGRPLDMWFYLPIRWLGGDPVAWAKWLGAAAWIGSAVCIASVLQRLGGLRASVATAIAVLVATLPVFDLLGELALWMNTACVLLFWLAWVLLARLSSMAGRRAIAVRLAALALFFVSFDLNSNLVLFYAVAAALVGLHPGSLRPATLLARLPRTAIRHADFLALPVVFWLWKTWFTPTSGFYATGYNQPSLAPARLAAGYVGLAVQFVVPWLVDLLGSPTWLVIAAAAAVAAAVAVRRTPDATADLEPARGTGPRLLGWGTLLLLAAAFPYIVVGQSLASEGWLTRNCILCPLPVAMMLVGLLMLATRLWRSAGRWAWIPGVAFVAVVGIGGCIHNYLVYQAFGVKQLSIRAALADSIRNANASVVQLRDHVLVPGTIPYYPPVIWTYLATGSSGAPTAFVIETAAMVPDVFQPGPDGSPRRLIPQIPFQPQTVDEAIIGTTMPYALERVPRTGPQLMAVVNPGTDTADPADVGRRYLLLSWLAPRQAEELVRRFTTVETHALPRLE
ncbi:MAG: hypothetical protein ACKO40_08415 [Planctomycetaceae bacterium]